MKSIKSMTPDEMYPMVEKEKIYPSLHVSEMDMPEINDWEVGKEYELKIKVKMTNKDEYESGRHTSARLEVVAYEDLTVVEDDPSNPKPGSVYGYNPKRNK